MLSLALFAAGLTLAITGGSVRTSSLGITLLFMVNLVATVAYLTIDQLTGDGFNESVLYHMQAGVIETGIRDFLSQATFTLLGLVVACILSLVLFRVISRRTGSHRRTSFGVVAAMCLGGALYYHPLAIDWRAMGETAPGGRLNDFYAKPALLSTRSTPKNLVYVYLESLERTYLDQHLFPNLTPKLPEFENEGVSFTNIEQAWGTSWTIAGMTATQCGIPLVTTGSGGSTMYGMSEFLPHARCMGDVLKDAGYHLSYMGGAHLEFAGKGKFYQGHGFDRVQGREELKSSMTRPGYMNSWGLYDDTLFELAWKEFEQGAAQEEPFALFLLTLDTHHPDGYPSAHCQQLEAIQHGDSMLDAVACSDYLVARFVERLRASPWANETVIVLASDHLAMPNKSYEQLQRGMRRNLFLALGTSIDAGTVIDRSANQFDMAPTVLALLGFEVSAFGFGRNLLEDGESLSSQIADFDKLLRGFTPELRQFWNLPVLERELELALSEEVLKLPGQNLELPLLLKLGEVQQSEPEQEIKEIYFPGYWYTDLKDNLKTFSPEDVFVWIDRCDHIDLIADEALHADAAAICIAGGQLGRTMSVVQATTDASIILLESILAGMNNVHSETRYRQQILGLEHGVRFDGNTKTALDKSSLESVRQFTQLSLLRYQEGDFAGAIEAAQTVLETDPKNSLAYNNICASYNNLGKFKESIEACKLALIVEPEFQLAQNNLTWARNELIAARSKATADEQVATDSSSVPALNAVGHEFYRIGDYESSLRCWRKALALDPQQAEMINNVAVSLIMLDRADEAVPKLEKAIELNPDEPLYLNNLNWAISTL